VVKVESRKLVLHLKLGVVKDHVRLRQQPPTFMQIYMVTHNQSLTYLRLQP
jgi:hypothetical protein